MFAIVWSANVNPDDPATESVSTQQNVHAQEIAKHSLITAAEEVSRRIVSTWANYFNLCLFKVCYSPPPPFSLIIFQHLSVNTDNILKNLNKYHYKLLSISEIHCVCLFYGTLSKYKQIADFFVFKCSQANQVASSTYTTGISEEKAHLQDVYFKLN